MSLDLNGRNKAIIWEPYHEYVARKKWEEENWPRIEQDFWNQMWWGKSLCYKIPKQLTNKFTNVL